jgi:hypothetical protein
MRISARKTYEFAGFFAKACSVEKDREQRQEFNNLQLPVLITFAPKMQMPKARRDWSLASAGFRSHGEGFVWRTGCPQPDGSPILATDGSSA